VLAIGLLLRAHWKIPGYAVLIIILLWALMTSISATRPDVLAGSMLYLPTAVMLFLMSFASKSLRKPLSYVALVYLTALLLRALDLPACAALPHGTHWLWHLLSAITIILVFRILLNATATQPHTTCRRVE